jgi:hypothetical protein
MKRFRDDQKVCPHAPMNVHFLEAVAFALDIDQHRRIGARNARGCHQYIAEKFERAPRAGVGSEKMTAKKWCAISKAVKMIAAAQNTSVGRAQVWLIDTNPHNG